MYVVAKVEVYHCFNIVRKSVHIYTKKSATKEKLIEDRPNIYAQYITAYQKDNITKTCLMRFWDFEKNGNLVMSCNITQQNLLLYFMRCELEQRRYVSKLPFNTNPHSFHRIIDDPLLSSDRTCEICISNSIVLYV